MSRQAREMKCACTDNSGSHVGILWCPCAQPARAEPWALPSFAFQLASARNHAETVRQRFSETFLTDHQTRHLTRTSRLRKTSKSGLLTTSDCES